MKVKNIFLIQNLLNKKSNSFTTNFKILKNHTNSIFHIDKLNDGRLISCSYELNIYKKNTYDLQLSIKEHSDCINSFTELHDKKNNNMLL